MLNVQKYLSEKVNLGLSKDLALASLKDEFGIKYKIYEAEGIVNLDYDQIESPKSHPVVVECRGLILEYGQDWEVVSKKFNRFFNLGECPDYYSDFNFEGSVAYEKVDGTLIGVYYNYFAERWELSTRGTAFAEGPNQVHGTFRNAAIKAFGFENEQEFQIAMGEFSILAREWPVTLPTFLFEYIGPTNRIVRRYEQEEMVLLGVEEKFVWQNSQSDWSHDQLDNIVRTFRFLGMNVRAPKTYKADNIEQMVEMVSGFENLDEGVVVYDPISNKRVKIKSQTYVQAHRLRGNDPTPSRKALLTVMFEGEISELLAYFPEFVEYYEPLQKEVSDFLRECEEKYEAVKHIQNQKEFAQAISDCKGKALMFEARKHGKTAVKVFEGMDLKKKLNYFL